MKGKKVIHWRGGNGGPILISSWKCNFSIYLDIQVYYLDIQAIITLLRLILVLCVVSFYSFNFLCYNKSPVKWRVPALKSIRLPEFWTYKDGTRFILKRNEVSIDNYRKITYSFSFFLNEVQFKKKIMHCSKNV